MAAERGQRLRERYARERATRDIEHLTDADPHAAQRRPSVTAYSGSGGIPSAGGDGPHVAKRRPRVTTYTGAQYEAVAGDDRDM